MNTPASGRPDPSRREPLWDRVDRNRFRLAVYLVVFAQVASVFIALAVTAAGFAAMATALAFPSAAPLGEIGRWVLGDGPWRPWAAGILCAAVYEAWALARSERWVLRRLAATFVAKGERLDTKMTLKDMAIAAGLAVAPALYTLDSTNINAFIFKAPGRRAVLGVTEGFLTRLTLAEQRAVFANLVARLASGDTMVSSAVSSLLAPLQWYREHRLDALEYEDRLMRDNVERRRENPSGGDTDTAVPNSFLLIGLLVPVILAGEIIAALQRRSQLMAAEKADAEGMLLLKDPDSMISALESCIRANNVVVRSGQAMADLFYCWTGDSTDDEDDPEWARVARLREVLGVWGWVPDESRPL